MELRTKRVTWGTISIVVREENGLDTFQEPLLFWEFVRAVYGKELDYGDIPRLDQRKLNEFSAMVSRTVSIEGDLGFEWVTPDSPSDKIKQAYQGLDVLAGGLVREWRSAIADLTVAPMGDPDLAPPEQVSDTKKKA